jgi:hypothetical protein
MLLQTNPKSRYSSAGGALGLVLIAVLSGAIDRQKHVDVNIRYRQAVVRASETCAHDAQCVAFPPSHCGHPQFANYNLNELFSYLFLLL